MVMDCGIMKIGKEDSGVIRCLPKWSIDYVATFAAQPVKAIFCAAGHGKASMYSLAASAWTVATRFSSSRLPVSVFG